MKALLLAAGLGTRLRPLTDDVAKPAIPFFGRPLIAHSLEWLARAGVEHVVVNLFHAPDSVRRAVALCQSRVAFTIIEEPTLLGTGGALVNARGALGDDAVLIVNGDAFIAAPPALVSELAAAHAASTALATLWLCSAPAYVDIANVDVRRDGTVVRMAGRPAVATAGTSRAAYLGVQVVSPRFIDRVAARIGAGPGCLRDDGWVPALEAGERIVGRMAPGDAFDLGTPARYLDAHTALRATAAPLSGLVLRSPGVFTAEPLPTEVTLIAPVVVGRGLIVRGPATLGPDAVLGQHVTLNEGASVTNSVVWDGEVVSGALRDSVQGAGHVVRGR